MKPQYWILLALGVAIGCSNGGGTSSTSSNNASTTGSKPPATATASNPTAAPDNSSAGQPQSPAGPSAQGTPKSPPVPAATGSSGSANSVASGQNSGGKLYTFTLAPKNGQVVYYGSTNHVSFPMPMVFHMTSKMTYQLKDGNIENTTQILDFQMPDMMKNVPAAERKQAEAPLQTMITNMKSMKVVILQAKNGTLLSHHVSGTGSFIGAMNSATNGNNSPFPLHPVHIGDTWKITTKDKDPMNMQYTLKSVKVINGHEIADIAGTGTFTKLVGGKSTTANAGSSSVGVTGDTYIDLKTGIMVRTSFTMNMVIPGGKAFKTVSEMTKLDSPPKISS